MEPPPVTNMPGRPKKKRAQTGEVQRRRKVQSGQQSQTGEVGSDLPAPPPEKIIRSGSRGKCTICHQEGHNRATCKDVSIYSVI